VGETSLAGDSAEGRSAEGGALESSFVVEERTTAGDKRIFSLSLLQSSRITLRILMCIIKMSVESKRHTNTPQPNALFCNGIMGNKIVSEYFFFLAGELSGKILLYSLSNHPMTTL